MMDEDVRKIDIDEMSTDELKDHAHWRERLREIDEMKPYMNTIAKYIVFEGIDGCGKTTQIKAIRDWLVALDKDVVRLREPTKDSPFGKQLREMFARDERPPYGEEVRLFEEDRRWHMTNRVKPALSLNVIILQDRSYFSTAAYQGHAGKFSHHDFIKMHERFSYIPDLVVLLDMDVDVARNRIGTRGEGVTAMEHRDIQVKVRETFLAIYKDYGASRNIVLVDANKPTDELTNGIKKIIGDRLSIR